jgi:hypothetical protein
VPSYSIKGEASGVEVLFPIRLLLSRVLGRLRLRTYLVVYSFQTYVYCLEATTKFLTGSG